MEGVFYLIGQNIILNKIRVIVSDHNMTVIFVDDQAPYKNE